MQRFLTHLECTACGAKFPTKQQVTVCPTCGKVPYARYDLASSMLANWQCLHASTPMQVTGSLPGSTAHGDGLMRDR